MAVIFMIKKMQRIQNVVENTLPSPNFYPSPFSQKKKHKSKLLNLFLFSLTYTQIFPDDKQIKTFL